MSEMSRRSFLRFLSAAPVAVKMGVLEAAEEIFNPHRVIFDMGRSNIWTPQPLIMMESTARGMKDWWQDYYLERLTERVFKPSPIFEALQKKGLTQPPNLEDEAFHISDVGFFDIKENKKNV